MREMSAFEFPIKKKILMPLISMQLYLQIETSKTSFEKEAKSETWFI